MMTINWFDPGDEEGDELIIYGDPGDEEGTIIYGDPGD